MTVFICTTENSGVDRYSRELLKYLGVKPVFTDRYNLRLHEDSLVERLKAFDEPVHFTNQHFGSAAMSAGLPFVVTVHDLERICFPFALEDAAERASLEQDAIAIGKADHIIAVSENTRNDLVRCLGIPERKITVVYNGVDREVFKRNGAAPPPFPYVLYVGSERPRKNLRNLLAAFAALKKSGAFRMLKLVKVGSPGRSDAFRSDTMEAIRALGLENEVIFLGEVSDHELAECYASASALVYPSLYEGFGLPVVEAMSCGCPVITSNVSSLPEGAGDAALLVDPHDVADLHKAMERLLTNEGLRRDLIGKGLERSALFSWTRAAETTEEVYSRVKAPPTVCCGGSRRA